MKCFILKTQADLSYELISEADSSLSQPKPSILMRVSASGLLHPTLEAPQAQLHASGRSQSLRLWEAAFAGSLHCMWFGNECRNLLWAFTFLCQCGLYCLNLTQTQGGDGGQCYCGAKVETAEIRCADVAIDGQVSGSAPSRLESCLRVNVCSDRDRPGKTQTGKMVWKQTALSGVPWWEDQCKS